MPQKATVPALCAHCQSAFFAQPRDIARGRGRFCSAKCSGAAGGKRTGQTHPQDGAGNFNYRHGDPKGAAIAYAARWQEENPKKKEAHRHIQWLLESGRLVKPSECSACGRKVRLDGHHDDYDRMGQVRWLCRRCHIAHHKAKLAA
jgi:ribosomal protein S27AE